MPNQEITVVLGTGEIGGPLCRILGRAYPCVGIDIEPVEVDAPCSVLHICYPFQIADFVGTTVRYIQKYSPSLTIINSTVVPGTTRKIYEAAGKVAVAYSPVRGKHATMEEHLLFYKKFVAGCDSRATEFARQHFEGAGFKTQTFRTPEIAELSKLLETTYLGLLVAWAQEVERFAARYGATFEEVNAFMEEIAFLPSHIFPGPIGGHCVMPNISLLRECVTSRFLEAVEGSNLLKEKQLRAPESVDARS